MNKSCAGLSLSFIKARTNAVRKEVCHSRKPGVLGSHVPGVSLRDDDGNIYYCISGLVSFSRQ